MTDEQKETIRGLRNQGLSYRQVSDETGISVSTLKSFCRRDFGKAAIKVKAPHPAGSGQAVCRFCGKPVIQTPGKRKREFCDDRCRSRYWVKHRSELPKKVTYTYTCAYCGKEFTVYGKRERKYCSQECYFADRFGLDEA